jgi:hypothetical protein
MGFPRHYKKYGFFLTTDLQYGSIQKIKNPEGKKVSDPTEPTAQWVVPIHLS